MLRVIGEFVLNQRDTVIPLFFAAGAALFVWQSIKKVAGLVVMLFALLIALDGFGLSLGDFFTFISQGMNQFFEAVPRILELLKGFVG